MRTMAVEMARGGVRFQPESRLTLGEQPRCGQGRARLRKIGIGALARQVLIALWRFLKTGERPAGAVRKAAVSGSRIPEDEQVPRSATRVVG
jgi:transposase